MKTDLSKTQIEALEKADANRMEWIRDLPRVTAKSLVERKLLRQRNSGFSHAPNYSYRIGWRGSQLLRELRAEENVR